MEALYPAHDIKLSDDSSCSLHTSSSRFASQSFLSRSCGIETGDANNCSGATGAYKSLCGKDKGGTVLWFVGSWDIDLQVDKVVDILESMLSLSLTLSFPVSVLDGCWTKDTAVPWNDDWAEVELVL